MCPRIRTDYSRSGFSGVYLRGDKLGKIDFGQMLEGFGRTQIQDNGVVTELKRLDGQRSMTSAVLATVAPIVILVVLKRSGRRVVTRYFVR